MSWGQIIGGIVTLVLAGIAVAAVISLLTYEEILSWFKPRLSASEKNIIGYSIMKHLDNGNYNTVQGIFDTDSQQILDSRTIESKEVDYELEKLHEENNGYVVYTFN
jgi:hypothetical protein